MVKNSRRLEPSEPLAYSVTDAARTAGIGRSTLYDLMAHGELAYVKIGSRRLIRHEELKALLKRFQVR
jgi:excisionase family DNA binding protein